jgi:hypothetical protein
MVAELSVVMRYRGVGATVETKTDSMAGELSVALRVMGVGAAVEVDKQTAGLDRCLWQ